MLKAAPFTLLPLRHLRTPQLGGVRCLCSSFECGGRPNCNCARCFRSKKMLSATSFTLRRHIPTPSLGGVRCLCSSVGGGASPNCNCACCSRSKKMLSATSFTLRRHIPRPSLGGGVRRFCSSSRDSASPNSDGNFYSETEARELFEIWCKKYGKTYSSEEEKVFRFDRFRGTLKWSTRENQKIENPEHRKFGTYENADQSEKEFVRNGGGWRPLFPMLIPKGLR